MKYFLKTLPWVRPYLRSRNPRPTLLARRSPLNYRDTPLVPQWENTQCSRGQKGIHLIELGCYPEEMISATYLEGYIGVF